MKKWTRTKGEREASKECRGTCARDCTVNRDTTLSSAFHYVTHEKPQEEVVCGGKTQQGVTELADAAAYSTIPLTPDSNHSLPPSTHSLSPSTHFFPPAVSIHPLTPSIHSLLPSTQVSCLPPPWFHTLSSPLFTETGQMVAVQMASGTSFSLALCRHAPTPPGPKGSDPRTCCEIIYNESDMQ